MDKLQELTDRLYNEGLAKGREAGDALVEEARKQAAETVRKAREEAKAIVAEAEKEAADLKVKVEGDLRMAAEQSVQATRQDIERLVVTKLTAGPVDQALGSVDFMKEIIRTVAGKFSAEEAVDLALMLPESQQAELEPFVRGELAALLGKGVEATFSKKVSGGFRIGPRDGSYFVSLTDETFKELVSGYLRPTTRKILYGDE